MKHIIVGASAAGMAAYEAIRKRDPTAEVVMLSDEDHPPYYRPLISYLIYGEKTGDDLVRHPLPFPEELDLRLNVRATELDPGTHSLVVVGRDGDVEHLVYDRLLLATGASPIHPGIEGLEGSGVYSLRTWDDAKNIAEWAGGANTALILGAGRIGMKSAFALRKLGIQVTVVELLDRLVPQQLDKVSAATFAEIVDEAGIQVVLGDTVQAINRKNGHFTSGTLGSGRETPADMIIIAIGVQPNLELATSGGLQMSRGLLVDNRLRASALDVYAAGDVVETSDIVTGERIVSGIWTNAAAMGKVAGDNMAGGNSTYPGAFGLLNAMELGGLPVISVGEIHAGPGNGFEVYVDGRGRNYRKLVFCENRLVGLIMVGNIERAGLYQMLIRERADVTSLKKELLGPRFHYGYRILSKPVEVDRYVVPA